MSIANTRRRKIRPTHPGEMLREDFLPDYGLTLSTNQVANLGLVTSADLDESGYRELGATLVKFGGQYADVRAVLDDGVVLLVTGPEGEHASELPRTIGTER